MKSRTIQGISFVLPLLLLAAIFLPGALTTPYHASNEQPFVIAHESTEEFNDTVTDRTAAMESAVPVEELSERQRRAFETAKAQEPSPYSGQQAFTPPVCKDILLVCDEYEEVPKPPSNGSYSSYTDYTGGGVGQGPKYGYGMIEGTDEDLYLVRVGFTGAYIADWTVLPIFEFLSRLLALGPFAAFLAYRDWFETTPNPSSGTLRYGVALLVLMFATPYLLMLLNITSPGEWYLPALALLPVVTWLVIIADIWRSRGEKTVGTEEKNTSQN
ncbi:hypothetical protein ACERIM_19335 [Natrinema sp. H-ect1]|uniref:hypothetical protein n=1 Tax=Natrinema sp. H-ect1 TaxID=3242700 RepID=UPI00359E341F